MNIPFRVRPIVFTITSAFFTAIIIVLVIIPTLNEILLLNDRVHLHRQALELLYRQGQNMRSNIEEYEKVKIDIPLMSSSVLELGKELEFITTLEEIAAAHRIKQTIHLDTSQLAPLASQVNMPYSRVLLRLDVQGTTSQLQSMLHDIESLPAYVNILTIAFASQLKAAPISAPSDTELPSPILSASLTAATYWKSPSAPYNTQ